MDNPEKKAAQEGLSRNLALSLLGLLAMFLVAIAGSLVWLAREHDALAAGNARTAIDVGLKTQMETLATTAAEYSYWDAASINIVARNADWIASNMFSYTEDASFDLFVVDYVAGEEIGILDETGTEIRTDLIPGALQARIVRGLRDSPPAAQPVVTEVAVIDGVIWDFAAAYVTLHSRPTSEAERDVAPVAIYGRRVTPETVAAIGDAAFIPAASVSVDAPGDAGMDTLPLLAMNGDVQGHAFWPRPLPGTEILTGLALPIGLVFLALIGIALAIARYIFRSTVKLEQALSMALEADKAKTQFLATISHELRTPMNGIIGAVQLLELTEFSEDDQELFDILKTCAQSQMTLIEEILTYGAMEAGQMSLREETVDLPSAMRAATGFATIAAREKGLTFDLIVPEDLPPVVTDEKRLQQVIVNLVGNAIKFTDEGGVEMRVALDVPAASGDARLHITVTDSGVGIAQEAQARIFERFTQVDDVSTRRAGGSGLGLAIARSIARMMGGDITVESVVGEGSTFRLDVPVPLAEGTAAPDGDVREAA